MTTEPLNHQQPSPRAAVTDPPASLPTGVPQGMDAKDTSVLAEPSPLIPAATVILVRDGEFGLETLMVERVGRGNFAGFSVFPGGRVDPEDFDPSAPDDEFLASRNAAVREAREEVALDVVLETLVPLSRWVPPPFEMKRFGTWFFVAPAVAGDIAMSEGELTAFHWLTPSQVLAEATAGTRTLAPPTWVTLFQLAPYSSVEHALGDLASKEPTHFETWPLQRKPMVLAWSPDVSYKQPLESVDLEAPGPRHRLYMHDDLQWEYVVSE
jgi:8-oxo-dGTP pyrophosphatase MutT (NUDIX family)